MKKITACALAGLIALQGLSGTAIAADSGVIRVGSAVVSAGETFSLPIQLEQNPGLAALSLNLSYDADMLELLGTEDGKILGSSTYLPGNDLTLNPYTMLWDDLAETNNTGTGTVVTLQFRALEGAVGSTAVSASVFQPSTYNIDLEDVAFETFSGTVSIAPDENTAAITVDTVTASPGSIAEVPVRIRSNPGIAALTLNISYDDTQLKLLGADDGKILGTSTFLAGNDMTMIPYTLMWDDLSDTNNTGNGIAAVLKFEVLAESGLAPVNVEVYQPSTYNIDLEEVTFAAVGGGVKIGAAETGTTPATTETTSTTETATSVSRTPNPDCDPRFVGEWMLWQEYQDGKLLVDNGAALPDGNGHFKRIVLFEDGTGKGYEAYRWPDMEEADFEMMAQNPYWNYKWTSAGDTVTLSLYLVMPDDPDAIDPTAFCGDSKLQYKDGLLHESDVAEDGSKMERTYKKSGASDVTGTQTTATATDTTRTTTNTTRTSSDTTQTTTETPPSDGTRVLEYDLSKIAPDDLSHVCYIYSGDGSGDALIKDDATAARIIAVKWTIHCPEDGDGQWRGGSMVINMNSNGNGGYNSEMWEVNGSDPDRYAAVPIGNSLYTLTREISGFQPGADNWLNVGWSVYSSSGEAELVRLQVILRDDGSTDTTYTTTDTTRTTTETTHTTTETTRTTTDTTYTTTDTTDSTTETTVTTTEITVPDGAGVIAVDTVHAAAGSTVEVPIRIRSNPGIAALSLILSYDPAQLRLVGVTDQKLLGTSDFIPGKDLTAIPYNMNWDDLSETNNTQEGIVAVLKFEVLAESGTAAVGIRLNQASTYNIDLKDVPFAVISGAVQIGGSDILMGDINCDGTVTPDDLILLMRFIAEAPGTSVPEAGLDAADMNADGLITLMDAAAVSAMLKP